MFFFRNKENHDRDKMKFLETNNDKYLRNIVTALYIKQK